MKRLLFGLFVAFVLAPLTAIAALADTSSQSTERNLVGAIWFLSFGVGTAFGGYTVRRREKRTADLAIEQFRAAGRVDVAEIARQVRIGEPLAARWLKAHTSTAINVDRSHRVPSQTHFKIEQLVPQVTALEDAALRVTGQPIRVRALEIGRVTRLGRGARAAVIVLLCVLSPILFLLAFGLGLLLAAPGVAYFAYLFFSEWDEFDAQGLVRGFAKGATVFGFVVLCLMPLFAGIGLIFLALAKFGLLRQVAIARGDQAFVFAMLDPASLLLTRYSLVELVPAMNASLKVVEQGKRKVILRFTTPSWERRIVVRTPGGLGGDEPEFLRNRELLLNGSQAGATPRPKSRFD